MSKPRHPAAYSQSEVLYTTQPFLVLKDLRALPEEDADFLELNRCFHMPVRTVQEEFINQYFLYLHPYYPLVNEKEFWDMYMGRESCGGRRKKMSLLVFQAMLFAASAFVSPVVLKNAGYTNVKVARNIFYRRAKFSAVEPHAGSTWLAIGIQNAIVAQTHNFQAPGASVSCKKSNKRLWWSLFWRDRVLTLGLRKPLQITPSSFNVNLDPITAEDLADEADASAVYDPRTKRQLAEILNFQCRLAVILTDTLSICYGPNAFDITYSLDNFETTLSHIRTARSNLARWMKEADVALYQFFSRNGAHRSTTLISSVVYIYAYAAQIALGNHEAMMIEQRQKGVSVIDDAVLRNIGKDISYATTETTKLVGFIVQEGLTQHLPISAIAYIAYPLMLSSIDERIAPKDPEDDEEQLLTRYHAQAMHLCSKRFEGAEDISRMITQIVQSTPIQLPLRPHQSKPPGRRQSSGAEGALSPSSKSLTKYWDELFITRQYMRLRLSLDYALITGRPPTEIDLPTSIFNDAGIKRLAYGPIHSLSSTTLYAPRKRRASESVAGLPRVIELDEKLSDDEAVAEHIENLDDLTAHSTQLVQREGSTIGSRPHFDYDAIWAANLFEEITDVLWA
ncbi:cutinase transcription factor 1 beta [Fusarium beomiforme]|uniref:Cutinase transcription factor 1 beta n=1 Tax=Fusarium beomiforme TaxID=44412 RepID=A0A9P5AU10_9HYPO|nr:cutinase transcription factor 1 beta [Fusarium beomiforme]